MQYMGANVGTGQRLLYIWTGNKKTSCACSSRNHFSVLFATCYGLLWNDKSATRHRISAYIYYVTGHRIPARALTARRNVHSVGLRSPTECTFRRLMRSFEEKVFDNFTCPYSPYTYKNERILLRGVFEPTNI